MASRRRRYPPDSEEGEDLVRLGFDLNLPIFTISPPGEPLDIELVKRVLFESTYRDPIYLPLAIDELTGSEGFCPMVVHSVQAVFKAPENDHLDGPVGCYNEPDWLATGYLVKSAHDPYPEHIAALALLTMNDTNRSKVEIITVQLRREMPTGSPLDITNPRTA